MPIGVWSTSARGRWRQSPRRCSRAVPTIDLPAGVQSCRARPIFRNWGARSAARQPAARRAPAWTCPSPLTPVTATSRPSGTAVDHVLQVVQLAPSTCTPSSGQPEGHAWVLLIPVASHPCAREPSKNPSAAPAAGGAGASGSGRWRNLRRRRSWSAAFGGQACRRARRRRGRCRSGARAADGVRRARPPPGVAVVAELCSACSRMGCRARAGRWWPVEHVAHALQVAAQLRRQADALRLAAAGWARRSSVR